MRNLIFVWLLCSACVIAQNPILPAGIYMADPAVRVWDDGRLYIYGSVDETTDYYCSHHYHVLSTDDMIHWRLHRDSFASRGEKDAVKYSDALLFAPDCIHKEGNYYLYYCMPDRKYAEGVAVSTDPAGPFEKAQPIDLHGINQIDPGVFIDDDGQAYYIWGQFTLKMARLKPNMVEIDTATIRDNVLTESEHYFHEGGHMIKRKGIYYLIYAHMGRGDRPTCIAYATGRSPFGPYKYGGVIVDNDDSDPEVWNNHGSIAEFKGQWYVFYHRSTHGSVMMRKICVEPIEFDKDGHIKEVEMTTQGAVAPLSASGKIEAEWACLLSGNLRVEQFVNGEGLFQIEDKDRAAYKKIDFQNDVKKFKIRIRAGKQNGRVDLALDRPWNGNAVSVPVQTGIDKDTWRTLTADFVSPGGIHTVWLRFYGETDPDFAVDWFTFE